MKKLAFLAATFLAGCGNPVEGSKNSQINLPVLINAQDLSAGRSFDVATRAPQGYSLLTTYISVTDADNSVTALNMTCTASQDGNTTDYTLQVCTTASGVCTSDGASWTKDPSGIASPKRWVWRVDINGFRDVGCAFTDTGGDGSDLLTVNGSLATD